MIGYASTDGDDWRSKLYSVFTYIATNISLVAQLANYLACDKDATSIDLYGLNVYRWCGDATATTYSGLISDFANFPIPAYFSEFGCISSPPRLWTEVAALYGSDMSASWSGGLAFSVSAETTFLCSVIETALMFVVLPC